MPKFGYNVNLAAINNQAQSDAILAGANMYLLMTVPQQIDDIGVNGQTEINQIAEWKRAIAPAKITWRSYSKKEGNWSVFPSNDVIITRWLSEGHLDVIRDDPANEVSLAGDNKQINQEFVASRVDLLEKASANGITVAVGAFSVGTPHHNLIADGTYDPLIRAVVEGGHYFSVHEYCPGIPGAGDVFSYSELLKPETVISKMKDELWPLGEYWLLRRSDRLVKQARELGLSDPKIIVTEAFIDYIPDAEIVLTQLRNRYGRPACNKDMRGVLAWREYYQVAFSNIYSDYQLQIDFLSSYLANNVYNVSWIKGVCLFSLNPDWDSPECHNWLNDSLNEFRRALLPDINRKLDDIPNEIPMPSDPPQEIDWQMRLMLVKSNADGSNIRIDYNKFAQKLGTIGENEIEVQLSENIAPDNGIDTYRWHKIVTPELEGYIADTPNFEFRDVEDTPPLPPEIDYDKIQKMIDTSISNALTNIALEMINQAELLYPEDN